MYARCPHCETVFAIAAAHLRAAHGHVQCGRCAEVFDAIPHLTDGVNEVPAPVSSASLAPPEPEAAEDLVPAALRDDLERVAAPVARGPRGDRIAARVLAIAALVALGAQHVWFQPRAVVASYPQARALVERWCEVTGCALGDGRDPERIRVVTRDVRVHPRFEGALQVSAVMVNTASLAQPYPRLRFSLFNVNGETIGSRVFEPVEYLGAPPATGAMLAPRRPLQIALELLAPEDAAVSFELKFL